MPEMQERDRRGVTAAAISNGAVQLLSEYTGRGPTRAHTVVSRDTVAIVLRDTLTKGERKLVEAGRADEVLRTRHAFQDVMREDLVALVEKHVQRKVIAFMSDNHIDPDVGVEFFVLEPQQDGASADGASADGASADGAGA
jgi:uncharacterized protein YbcI